MRCNYGFRFDGLLDGVRASSAFQFDEIGFFVRFYSFSQSFRETLDCNWNLVVFAVHCTYLRQNEIGTYLLNHAIIKKKLSSKKTLCCQFEKVRFLFKSTFPKWCWIFCCVFLVHDKKSFIHQRKIDFIHSQNEKPKGRSKKSPLQSTNAS